MYNDTYEGVGAENYVSRRTPKPLNQNLALIIHYPYSIGIEYIQNFYNIMTESSGFVRPQHNINMLWQQKFLSYK